MEKPRGARLLHKPLVLYQRVALYLRSQIFGNWTFSKSIRTLADGAFDWQKCTLRVRAWN